MIILLFFCIFEFSFSFICYGTNSTSQPDLVCSSHGDCVGENECVCDEFYFLPKCDVSTCNGILSNDSSVCKSRGNCISYNHCECSDGYEGYNCEKEERSYYSIIVVGSSLLIFVLFTVIVISFGLCISILFFLMSARKSYRKKGLSALSSSSLVRRDENEEEDSSVGDEKTPLKKNDVPLSPAIRQDLSRLEVVKERNVQRKLFKKMNERIEKSELKFEQEKRLMQNSIHEMKEQLQSFESILTSMTNEKKTNDSDKGGLYDEEMEEDYME